MIPESIFSIDMNKRLDDKINASITQLLESVGKYEYSVSDLTEKVNSEETLEEYIRDTENHFGLPRKELTSMSSAKLTAYVGYLDTFWEV